VARALPVIAISIDGALLAPEQATISVLDRGLLYGDGCFEVLRTWGGAPRDLEAHLDRLLETARFLELAAIERPRLAEAVHRTLAAAGPGEQRIRIVLTRGPGSLAARLGELGPGRAIVIVEPLPPQPAALSLAVVDWPLPARAQRGHKTLAYLDAVIARELARAAGADEAIRIDAEGHAVEGATCNLFAIHGGEVSTPPVDRGALPGIVRARVLAICARDGIAAHVRPLPLRDLWIAQEVFVTSSLRGVVPVTRIDRAPFVRGTVTERLAAAYAAAMRAST
jgi:branched-chain amino acid aminotransferase